MGSQDLKNFVTCPKCGKKLIERKKNGIWHFIFGKSTDGGNFVPVEMFIQGNIKIKCLRRSCGQWTTLNYFPPVLQLEEDSKPDSAAAGSKG